MIGYMSKYFKTKIDEIKLRAGAKMRRFLRHRKDQLSLLLIGICRRVCFLRLNKICSRSNGMKNIRLRFVLTLSLFQIFCIVSNIAGQTVIEPANKKVVRNQVMPNVNLTVGRYLDQNNGTTADEAVRIALENNGEIKALRDELEATRAMIRQAELRPNPHVKINGSHESFIGNRYSAGISVNFPLELGGRRRARVTVAENQFKVREAMLTDIERRFASDVRSKFGESLAKIEKLKFLEELLANVDQGFKIISAKVTEGSNAPLERNMSLVELNRIRSMREMATAKVEIKLLELRNVMGIEAAGPLRIKGNFENLFSGPPSLRVALKQAIELRPDLQSLHLTLALGKARLEQARAGGRLDAGVSQHVPSPDCHDEHRRTGRV